jgi:tetratricopeptide (TPR) repeat protein
MAAGARPGGEERTVAENPRIEELRRRVQKDKASIAFAQLAEEYRRAGRFEEAIETCRTGLAHHPGYLSAHVTFGRALIEVGELQQAQDELKHVLDAAPENLAALKGLADIHYRRGEQQEALAHYRRALEFAPHDPDLEHLVSQIARDLEPARPPAEIPGGLSFEEAMGEFLAFQDPTPPGPPAVEPAIDATASVVEPVRAAVETAPVPWGEALGQAATVVDTFEPQAPPADAPETPAVGAPETPPAEVPETPVVPVAPAPDGPTQADIEAAPQRAALQVEALERWLDAILVDRQTPRN